MLADRARNRQLRFASNDRTQNSGRNKAQEAQKNCSYCASVKQVGIDHAGVRNLYSAQVSVTKVNTLHFAILCAFSRPFSPRRFDHSPSPASSAI